MCDNCRVEYWKGFHDGRLEMIKKYLKNREAFDSYVNVLKEDLQ